MVSFGYNISNDIIVTITDDTTPSNNGSITLKSAYSNASYRLEAVEFLSDESDASNLTEDEIIAYAINFID